MSNTTNPNALLVDAIAHGAKTILTEDADLWMFEPSIEALMREMLDRGLDHEVDVIKALPAQLAKMGHKELSLVELFDFPHPSDERCELRVLLLGDVPFALHAFKGDQSSYDDGLSIVDHAVAADVLAAIAVVELARSLTEARSKAAEPDYAEKEFVRMLDNMGYLQPMGAGMFRVGDPRGCEHSFVKGFKRHKAVYICPEGKAYHIVAFKGWKAKKAQMYTTSPEDQICFIEVEGGTVFEVESQRVVFRLTPSHDQRHLEAVCKHVPQGDFWKVTDVRQRHGNSSLPLREKGGVPTQICWAETLVTYKGDLNPRCGNVCFILPLHSCHTAFREGLLALSGSGVLTLDSPELKGYELSEDFSHFSKLKEYVHRELTTAEVKALAA